MKFQVKAVDGSNALRVYTLDAVNEADARRQIDESGVRLISLQTRFSLEFGRPAKIPLVNFSQELAALLDAGLSLTESIETLVEKEDHAGMRQALDRVRRRLFEGRTLASALEEMPASFPPLYVAMIRASERTGALTEALTRYVEYQKQVDVLRKRLISASIYPAVLCIAGTLVSLFLVGYVVPRFSSIYDDVGSELPLASRVLMTFGQYMDQHGLAVVLITLIGLVAIGYGLVQPAFRGFVVRQISRIPSLGAQLRIYELARMYRTVGMLLRGGIAVVPSLLMSEGLLSAALRPQLRAATQAVREGVGLSEALDIHGLTTPVSMRMIRVGERGGNMGEMMERIAAFYDEELSRMVDVVSRLIEPLLMAFIGLIIGGIVVLMYFPIFELAGSLE